MLRDVLERSARPFSKRGSGFFASAATQRALTAFSVARCPRGKIPPKSLSATALGSPLHPFSTARYLAIEPERMMKATSRQVFWKC